MTNRKLAYIAKDQKPLTALVALPRSRASRFPLAKPLKGFGDAGVLEVVEDHDGDTYRAVYTVRFVGRVFVLHVFQKKSKRGAETPKGDKVLIAKRLKVAREFKP